mgnify:CR=1 FL=1
MLASADTARLLPLSDKLDKEYVTLPSAVAGVVSVSPFKAMSSGYMFANTLCVSCYLSLLKAPAPTRAVDKTASLPDRPLVRRAEYTLGTFVFRLYDLLSPRDITLGAP